jgi:hypothetical protein
VSPCQRVSRYARFVLWAGGKAHEPLGYFTFEKEDLGGSNPKLVTREANGVKWKAKPGLEARSEAVAARLVWAAGYYANEGYFVSDMRIEGMPARLHRGLKAGRAGRRRAKVRLKRETEEKKKTGIWQWGKVGFAGSREWNGSRVLMAHIGNWDRFAPKTTSTPTAALDSSDGLGGAPSISKRQHGPLLCTW